MYGLGDTINDDSGGISYKDILSGAIGVFTSREERKRQEALTASNVGSNTNANIESQLSTSLNTNNIVLYASFGLLLIGALVAIKKNA